MSVVVRTVTRVILPVALAFSRYSGRLLAGRSAR